MEVVGKLFTKRKAGCWDRPIQRGEYPQRPFIPALVLIYAAGGPFVPETKTVDSMNSSLLYQAIESELSENGGNSL